MTIGKLFYLSFLQWLLLTIIKIAYFKDFLFTGGIANVLYWLFTAIVAIAIVRRLGVMNFLEAIFVLIFWFLMDLFLDLVITAIFTGISIFREWQLWFGYLILVLVVFAFHKKRHIQIRKEHAHLYH